MEAKITYTVLVSNQSAQCSASATVHLIPQPALIDAEICMTSYILGYDRNIVQWIVPPSHVLDSINVFQKKISLEILLNKPPLKLNRAMFGRIHTPLLNTVSAEYQISILDTCGFTTPFEQSS